MAGGLGIGWLKKAIMGKQQKRKGEALQTCMVIAFTIWVLYQLMLFLHNNTSSSSPKSDTNAQNKIQLLGFNRKGFFQVETRKNNGAKLGKDDKRKRDSAKINEFNQEEIERESERVDDLIDVDEKGEEEGVKDEEDEEIDRILDNDTTDNYAESSKSDDDDDDDNETGKSERRAEEEEGEQNVGSQQEEIRIKGIQEIRYGDGLREKDAEESSKALLAEAHEDFVNGESFESSIEREGNEEDASL